MKNFEFPMAHTMRANTTPCDVQRRSIELCSALQHATPRCNTLQHAATRTIFSACSLTCAFYDHIRVLLDDCFHASNKHFPPQPQANSAAHWTVRYHSILLLPRHHMARTILFHFQTPLRFADWFLPWEWERTSRAKREVCACECVCVECNTLMRPRKRRVPRKRHKE